MSTEHITEMVSKNPIVHVVNRNFALLGTLESALLLRGPTHHGGLYQFVVPAQIPAQEQAPATQSYMKTINFHASCWRENYGWKDEYVLIVEEKDIKMLRRLKEFKKWP